MLGAFTSRSFLIRWAAALALVFGTFNPTGWSYYNWMARAVTDPETSIGPWLVIVGLALIIAYVIYLRATWRSIGPVGVALVTALLGAFVWLAADLGLLDPAAVTPMTWAALAILATVLAVGISWSHIRRRISGQLDTDDVGAPAGD